MPVWLLAIEFYNQRSPVHGVRPGSPGRTIRFALKPSLWLVRLALLVTTSVVFSAAVPTADQAQTPVIKSRTDIVRVDVSVIDRTGKPVVGLTERDFSVTENGVPQRITSFVAEGAAEPRGAGSDFETVAVGRRVFLIILGVYQWDAGVRPHEGAATFVRSRLRSGDLAAVMAFGRVTALVEDHELVATVIQRAGDVPKSVWNAVLEERLKPYDSSTAYNQPMDKWLTPPSAPAGFIRSVVPLLLGTAELGGNVNEARWEAQMGTFDLLKVVAGIEYLRHIEGEKHIVLMTHYGFTPPIRFVDEGAGMRARSAEDDRLVAQRASDAGIALDVIQVGSGTTLSIMSSRTAADTSGGQFTSVRTAEEQFRRIDDATRNGYVLGYVPVNPRMDGKLRKIDVRVNRKDVTLVYRRGYTAQPDLPPIPALEILTRQRLRQAAANMIPLTDLRVRAKPTLTTDAGRQQLNLEITIDLEGLQLSETAERTEGAIDLMVIAGDSRREVVGQIEQHMKLSMTPALYEKAKAGGIPYTAVVPLTGTPRYVKVVVYNFESDRLGTADLTIR